MIQPMNIINIFATDIKGKHIKSQQGHYINMGNKI